MKLELSHDINENFLGVKTTGDLNKAIADGKFPELVRLSEAYHDKRMVEISNEIIEKKKRIILIAGPSSSGKTTFAKKLCTLLKVSGLDPLYMGTDDYFVEREETPKDENGQYNFEDLEAVDVELFNSNMLELLSGKEVDLPRFDFLTGHKVFGERLTKIGENQPIVIEGIHALNDAMTPLISKEDKYKIFICPITSIQTNENIGIEPIDHRMLRRMSRDYRYRAHSAAQTIAAWPKVRMGEEKNIFPFVDNADVRFNTSHIYEIAILKRYTWSLLSAIMPEEPEFKKARALMEFLKEFDTYSDDGVVPNDSIIREFIGGSVYTDDSKEGAKSAERNKNYAHRWSY